MGRRRIDRGIQRLVSGSDAEVEIAALQSGLLEKPRSTMPSRERGVLSISVSMSPAVPAFFAPRDTNGCCATRVLAEFIQPTRSSPMKSWERLLSASVLMSNLAGDEMFGTFPFLPSLSRRIIFVSLVTALDAASQFVSCRRLGNGEHLAWID